MESGDIWSGTVHYIVARIPGTDSTRAILLAGHYDAVPTGPGAAYCGSGVVTVLETVRALLAATWKLGNVDLTTSPSYENADPTIARKSLTF